MIETSPSGLPKAVLLAAAATLMLAPAADAARISNPVASFSGLDKITGRMTSFDVYVGETVQFGALQVTPRACFNRDDKEAQRVDAFVEVDEITLDRKIKRIFNGWMFAESPALNAIEHPIFDVWLKECKLKTDVPPPPNLKIPPSGPDPLAAPATTAEVPAPPAPAAPEAPDAAAPATPPVTATPADPAAPAQDPVVVPQEQPLPAAPEPDADLQGQQDIPSDDLDAPSPADTEDLPPLLPPEPVPDDGSGNNGAGQGGFPPVPGTGQQAPSGSGLF